MVIGRSIVRLLYLRLLISREREEEYDAMTFGILWELASNHPESGVCTMSCVEYHDLPLEQSGLLREGQKEVWFKDVVRDVFALLWVY